MSPDTFPESPPTSWSDQSSTNESVYDHFLGSDMIPDPLRGSQVEPVAVIGLSLEFPQQATSPEAFWQMLVEARSGRTETPKDRFNLDAFHHPDASRQDNFNIREGHYLKKDLGAFDAPFFSITPAEAACMDPQQRGLLETAYRAFENAGIRLEDAAGSKTSVHVGSFAHDWQDLIKKDPLWHGSYEATGSESTFLANRVSWFFDLAGPSVSLDTACSSSLMALHLACQSLRSRESSMGLVGGANVFFSPDNMTSMANLGMLSQDGICYSFDHRANGYARGEGYGFVVVKRLSDALKDGDTIRTIIRATGSNQDGKTPGITQPNGDAQERLIRDTYESAGLERNLTRYFEAHGTGTPTGDPIEARAIAMAFDHKRSQHDPLYIGSVKTNIGHLEGASGIASLIKTILILEKAVIPPNIWFEKTNPRIPERDWNIKFPTVKTNWPDTGLRRASVNSFGLGGSNVHVVLDDVLNYLRSQGTDGNHLTVDPVCCKRDALERRQGPRTHGILVNGLDQALKSKVYVWSAADEDGLRRLAQAYASHLLGLKANQDIKTYLENLSYTLFAKRSLLRWRSYVVANSLLELRQALEQGAVQSFRSTNSRKLAFIFTGQGAQWHAMGRELLRFPVYKSSLLESQSILSKIGCEWALSGNFTFPINFAYTKFLVDELAKGEDTTKIHNPEYSQPICTALQIALIDLLESCGQSPYAVVGHSSGEIAAAYCAGALSKWSALKVAFHRGCLAAKLAKFGRQGAMMSVGLSEVAAKHYISFTSMDNSEQISIACINSPKNVTLSGTEPQISALKSVFEREGVAAKVLRVNVAYHSKAMDEIAFEYGDLIEDITTRDHQLERPLIVSSVTGSKIVPDEMSKGNYWVRNLTSPVRFSEALINLCWLGRSATNVHGPAVIDILEIGPHSTLKWPIKDTLAPSEHGKTFTYDSLLTRGASAITSSFSAIGRLHCLGYAVNLLVLNNPLKNKQNLEVLAELPEYPFNHSQSYWFESRLSKNSRFRTHPRHELLGTQVPDWTPKEAKWRHRIRQSENPWIVDHKVNGIELYPAGGLLVMAIEAARQISSTTNLLTGYRLTDVYFLKPLMSTSKAEGSETQISLRHLPDEDSKASESKAFAILTHEGGDWTENCRGTITLEYSVTEVESIHTRESRWESKQAQQLLRNGIDRCNKPIEPVQLYRRLEAIGLGYGPKFRTLHDICYGDDEAVATVKLCQWATDVEQNHYQKHIIHPTALDGLIQLSLPAMFQRSGNTLNTMVPKYVRSVWITSHCLSTTQNAAVKAHAQHIRGILGSSESNILALDNVTDEAQVVIKGLQTAKLGSHSQNSQASRKRLCYAFDWKPDTDHLSNQGILEYCPNPSVEPSDKFIEELEFMCFSFMSSALDVLAGRDSSNFKHHIRRYIHWMQHQSERYDRGELIHWRPDWPALRQDKHHMDKVISRVERFSAEGELYAKIGRNLLGIIEGKVDALDLIFTSDLATRFYQEANGTYQGLQTIRPCLDALAHKNPGLKILEIGAGTGSSTGFLLDVFASPENKAFGALRYDEYTFTDISSGFFEKAKKRFEKHADHMTYATLDIEQDPLQQGFLEGEYDLVLAANVLHATSNIETTLHNTRKLLKPGGKLVLSEVFNDAVIRLGFAFGLLPGWWLGTEESRQEGPLLPEAGWNTALCASGFSGTDLVFKDWEGQRNHVTNTMISTAISQAQTSHTPEIVIVSVEESDLQSATADQIKDCLTSIGVSCTFRDISRVTPLDLEKRLCVFLPEMETSFLKDPSEVDYVKIKGLFYSSAGVLWVTRGGGYAPTRPETGMIEGLSRCVRSEDSGQIVVTLALENASDAQAIAQYIARIVDDRFRDGFKSVENEYQERDGRLCINRLVEAIDLNDYVYSRTSTQEARQENLNHEERALALKIASPGMLNTIQYVEDPELGKVLADDEIEINVQAVGLNLSDALTAFGRLPESDIGMECAGVVARAGSSADFVPGDRVCLLALGTFKTRVRSRAMTACKIPDRMSFCEAAAFPLAFVTAFHALCGIANMGEGASIFIHSAADATGQAAIQLSQQLKAEIFVTVGSEEEKRFLMARYSIQEDHIFSSQGLLFCNSIQRITNNRGVDVVLNTLAGEGRRRSWECLASYGTFIDIGMNIGKLTTFASKENCRYVAMNILHMVSDRPHLIKRTMDQVSALLENNKVSSPQPLQIYDNSQLEGAFRSLQTREAIGKSVVEFHKDDLVAIVPSLRPTYEFEGDKTYIISGGLGGLGRQIIRWMARRGARYLIILSRSGASSKEARELLGDMQKMGVQMIAAPCDVSDEVALASILTDAAAKMPPIKGCIQASMVLEDSLFESMHLSAFTAATKPKVHGSWNLHKLLPAGLDFFVLLSSVSGVVGCRAQANYAAGNTYQDTLARHRTSQGEKAVSLSLGTMASSGYVAERPEIMDAMMKMGYPPIDEAELLALLEFYCDPDLAVLDPARCQIVTGLNTPAKMRQMGLEEVYWMHDSRFKALWQMDKVSHAISLGPTNKTVDYKTLLAGTTAAAEAAAIVSMALFIKLADTLSMPSEDIDAGQPMHAFGVDSLVAVEIRNWLGREFGVALSVFEILGKDSIADLSAGIARKCMKSEGEE